MTQAKPASRPHSSYSLEESGVLVREEFTAGTEAGSINQRGNGTGGMSLREEVMSLNGAHQ